MRPFHDRGEIGAALLERMRTTTPFREDLWDLPAWTYPIHWTLEIIYGLWPAPSA